MRPLSFAQPASFHFQRRAAKPCLLNEVHAGRRFFGTSQMRYYSGVLVFLGMSVAAVAQPVDDSKKDQQSLQGVWRLVALKREGKAATKDELKAIKNLNLAVKEDQLSHAIQSAPFRGTFKLDAT